MSASNFYSLESTPQAFQVHPVTTESDVNKVVKHLEEASPLSEKPVDIVGVGGMTSLEYLVARIKAGANINNLYVIDISPSAITFWQNLCELMVTVPKFTTKEEFIHRLATLFEKQKLTYFPSNDGDKRHADVQAIWQIDKLEAIAFDERYSWVSNLETITQVQNFFQADKVKIVQADLASPSFALPESAVPETIYISNIGNYLASSSYEQHAQFAQNVYNMVCRLGTAYLVDAPNVSKNFVCHQRPRNTVHQHQEVGLARSENGLQVAPIFGDSTAPYIIARLPNPS